jgi:putative CocE/NonD family hydrolase
MKDGVRIAVEVLLPKDLPPGTKLPALFRISRFGRARPDGGVSEEDRFWVRHGFARVLVDERGTGASFGTSRYGPATVADLRELVDWVVGRPWSNGRVGAIGVSVEGTAAEWLAVTGHPTVAAVAPWFSDYNYYTDLVRPGGVFDDWVVKNFRDFTALADAGRSATRVDTDSDGSLLKRAVAEHRDNIDIYEACRAAEFADDRPRGLPSLLDISIPAARAELRRARVPMLVLVSWFDAGTVQGALQRFRDFPNAQEVIIGPWSHGGGYDANPFSPPGTPAEPGRQRQWLEALRFFNRHLKDGAPADEKARRVHYWTVGENEWHSTAEWPPRGLHPLALHLNPDRSLAGRKEGPPVRVKLAVTSTGDHNRWHTQMGGGPVSYADALKGMSTLPAFTGEPLTVPLEITGQPVLRLRLACARSDPSVLAYLVAVDPGGRALYLTEGHLRLVHRKPAPAEPTRHTYRREDALPVPVGEEVEADLTLLPVSALLPEGYRLRLLLAAGDRPTFAIGGEYEATISPASRIELPARERPDFKESPTPGDAAGFYEGAITSKQAGKLDVTLNLRREKGKYEGELVTPVGTFPIRSADFAAGRLRLHFEAGGAAGTVEARLEGKSLRGTFRTSDDEGPLELSRVGGARAPGWDTPTLRLSKGQWREDLRFFAAELPKRHANAFHHVPRRQFDAEVAALDRQIDALDADAVLVGMARIAALVGDGHTHVQRPPDDGNLPIDVRRFGDDYRVVAVGEGLHAALGTRVVKVHDTPIARVRQLLWPLTPQDENPALQEARVEALLTVGIYLHGLGITPKRDRVRYTLADDSGKEFAFEVRSVPRGGKTKWTWAFQEPPLYRRRPGETFWYTYLAPSRTVYCNFRAYDDLGRHAKGLFELVREKGPEKLVIDLRQNGGGDYTEGEKHLIEPVRRLAGINRKGHLFVLIGPYTFSAAMSNAAQFRSRTAALLVGEPVGEKPNSYQESREMRLPHSHLVVGYSVQFYKFVEGGDNEIRPDHPVGRSWEAFKAGRDPALEWVLRYPDG